MKKLLKFSFTVSPPYRKSHQGVCSLGSGYATADTELLPVEGCIVIGISSASASAHSGSKYGCPYGLPGLQSDPIIIAFAPSFAVLFISLIASSTSAIGMWATGIRRVGASLQKSNTQSLYARQLAAATLTSGQSYSHNSPSDG